MELIENLYHRKGMRDDTMTSALGGVRKSRRKEGRLRDFKSDKERGGPTNPKMLQTSFKQASP